MTPARWTPQDRNDLRRAITTIRNAVIDARAQLAVYGPMLAKERAEEVKQLRVALIDADSALATLRNAVERSGA